MQLFLSFILFCIINTPLLSAAVDDSIGLEDQINTLYSSYKTFAPASTPTLRRPATFVGYLHDAILTAETEYDVAFFSNAIRAVIGRGAGVGGLRTPRNAQDKSHLLTAEEKAIIVPALFDAERLIDDFSRRQKAYFGSEASYYEKAESNAEAREALTQHRAFVEKRAQQVWDIKDSFNNPQDLGFEPLRKKLTNNLLHLDLSQIAKQRAMIQNVRSRYHSSKFDMFSMAFHDPTLLNTIFYDWDVKDSYVPIAYFVLHGLPDYYGTAAKKDFIRRVRAVAQIPELFGILKMPLFTLLKESLETTDSYKKSSRVPNVITLQVLLDQGLPGLDEALPETSPRLTPTNRNYMLKLFANARKQTYEDPLHTEILLDAFDRFMKYYPDWPLEKIMTVLVDGTSSSATDKNGFYFEAMRIIYHKAIELYYPANKDEFLHIVRQIFSKRCWDPRYLDLKNQLAADLLVKDLDVNEIGSFGWVNSESADSLPWIAKFKALIKVMENNGLIPLLKDGNITSYFKSLVTEELLERKPTGLLSAEEEAVIIELNTWNSLKEKFRHHGENEEILASTLKSMKDSGLLNAERILHLARMYKTPQQKAALKAVGDKDMFRYEEGGEDKFNHQGWAQFRAMTNY